MKSEHIAEELSPLSVVNTWYETRDPNLVDPDVEWNVCQTFPGAGTYYGRDAVYEDFFANLIPQFYDFAVERELAVETEDKAVVVGFYKGKVTKEAESFAMPFTHVWTVTNGLISRIDQHAETGILDRAFADAKALS